MLKTNTITTQPNPSAKNNSQIHTETANTKSSLAGSLTQNIEKSSSKSANNARYIKSQQNIPKPLSINTWKEFDIYMYRLIKKSGSNNLVEIEYINQMRLMFSKIQPNKLSNKDIEKYIEISEKMLSVEGKINASLELLQNPINFGYSSINFTSYSKAEYEFDRWHLTELSKLISEIEAKFPILTTKEMLKYKPHRLNLSAEQMSNTGLIQPTLLTIDEVIKNLK